MRSDGGTPGPRIKNSGLAIITLDSRLRGNERIRRSGQVNGATLRSPHRKFVNLRAAGLLVSRVLHIRHGVELDIDDVVADLLDLADIDVLHDVAGCRIDGDGSARAFPLHALG